MQQQVGDAARDGLNIDIGRQHRNQYAVGAARKFDELVFVNGRRRIDDDALHFRPESASQTCASRWLEC